MIFSRPEFLVDFLVDIFITVEKSNPRRYSCRPEQIDFQPSPEISQSFDLLYDTIGLNLKSERAFVLMLENILGLSAGTHHDRKSTTYYHDHSLQCSDAVFSVRMQSGLRYLALTTLVVRGSRHGIIMSLFLERS